MQNNSTIASRREGRFRLYANILSVYDNLEAPDAFPALREWCGPPMRGMKQCNRAAKNRKMLRFYFAGGCCFDDPLRAAEYFSVKRETGRRWRDHVIKGRLANADFDMSVFEISGKIAALVPAARTMDPLAQVRVTS